MFEAGLSEASDAHLSPRRLLGTSCLRRRGSSYGASSDVPGRSTFCPDRAAQKHESRVGSRTVVRPTLGCNSTGLPVRPRADQRQKLEVCPGRKGQRPCQRGEQGGKTQSQVAQERQEGGRGSGRHRGMRPPVLRTSGSPVEQPEVGVGGSSEMSDMPEFISSTDLVQKSLDLCFPVLLLWEIFAKQL